ncbi:MAG: porin family protein [Bacteroidales bacterium]
MKNLALTSSIVFLFFFTSSAQLINLGVKLGFNSSKMPVKFSNVNDIKDEVKIGYLAGLFVRINLPVVFLQPEIYFSKKGGDFKSNTLPQIKNQEFTQQTVINTIDLPLLIGIKLIDLNAVNLKFMGGPLISFVTSKDVSSQINGISSSNTTFSSEFKNTNWGVQFGGGINILNLSIDIRYEWGLNNISDNPFSTIKPRLLNVSLGLKLL